MQGTCDLTTVCEFTAVEIYSFYLITESGNSRGVKVEVDIGDFNFCGVFFSPHFLGAPTLDPGFLPTSHLPYNTFYKLLTRFVFILSMF